MPTKIVNLVEMILRKTMNEVEIDGTLADSFDSTSGLRQADSLSAFLLNLTVEEIICIVTVYLTVSIVNTTGQGTTLRTVLSFYFFLGDSLAS